MKKTTALLLCLFATPLATQANEFEFSLSEDSVTGVYLHNYDAGEAHSEVRWLHNEGNGNSDTRTLIDGGYYAHVDSDETALEVGGRIYWADADGFSGYGFAPGVRVKYFFTQKLFLRASAHYSPDITTGKDIEHLRDLELRLTLKLNSRVAVHAGFRDIEADIADAGDVEVHSGAFLGGKIVF